MKRPPAPPPYPVGPGGAIELPSAIVHELFHMVVDGRRADAIEQVITLTGANAGQAGRYVDTLARRR